MSALPSAPSDSQRGLGWDTTVVVIAAESFSHLRQRLTVLQEYLQNHPEPALADLGFTLAIEARNSPTEARIGFVASSIPDLLKKLNRAIDRLADANFRQIRDAGGVYCTSDPLARQGTLAVLFPGEGAQYLNMLADLCPLFPVVEEAFASADLIAEEAGHPEWSLRNILHVPSDLPEADRLLAEARLRRIGPSLLGVLLGDMALFQVLAEWQLPIAAMAGHSAGELAALAIAGGIALEKERLGSRLLSLIEAMEQHDEHPGNTDVTLIAVGAGAEQVIRLAEAITAGAVQVAMDNCPHQCVAVGPTHLVLPLEAALTEQGIVCERLPFHRPYHTPLFEASMAPFREFFAAIPFAVPRIPVYSCTTAELFPPDPAAIHELAVNHWVRPVEFTRMIRRMHDDGVRLFVESGPRGNLSAFVEDSLRGRKFAALPANLPRRSGPSQLNHLAAQLFTHGVPLDLKPLFINRAVSRIDWERSDSTVSGKPYASRNTKHTDSHTIPQSFDDPPSRIQTQEATDILPEYSRDSRETFRVSEFARADPVLANHFQLMEQFLAIQQEVMTAFLTGQTPKSDSSAERPGLIWELPALSCELVGDGVHAAPSFPPASGEVSAPVSEAICPYALIQEIVQWQPGHSIVARRALDIREDLYVDHHTLGGRGVSQVDPSQNGLPVLPMTFSLEAMAEAAAVLVPGKVVIALREVRLYRWVPFDPQPTTLEVRATIQRVDPETGQVEVVANVRDLGNSFLPDGAIKPSSEAVVILADRYPEPPAPQPFMLSNEQPCRSTIEDLRRNMFHGPVFWMIRSLDRWGTEGIEGTLEVQSRDTWLASNPDPRTLLDPVLTDAAMHILGAWHLEQPDWSGRILLPFEVQSAEYFGPPPEPGTIMRVRGHNEQETARFARHGLELFHPDGRLWLRLTGAGYWRFYLPFGDVNFFGPKNQYFLTSHNPEAIPEEWRSLACCRILEIPNDLKQPVLRASGVRVTMTPREQQQWLEAPRTEVEKDRWFFPRLVGKDAIRAFWQKCRGQAMFPADLECELFEDGQFRCWPRGDTEPTVPFPCVSVAMRDNTVLAVAADSVRFHAVGVGLERLSRKSNATANSAGSMLEARFAEAFPHPAEGRLRLTAARHAIASAYSIPPESVELTAADPQTGWLKFRGCHENSAKAWATIRVFTFRQHDRITAVTLRERAQP